MSKELVPSPRTIAIEEQHAEERKAALERLTAEAETADAQRAREIMLQGRVIAGLLKSAKIPFEESRLAGKASVVAARRLGRIIEETSCVSPNPAAGMHSPRRRLIEELGLARTTARHLKRLAAAEDPVFQRYIQDGSLIPSINGALMACSIISADAEIRYRAGKGKGWRGARRRKAGIQTPKNPSLDEAYSLIVRALGHLSAPSLTSSHSRRDLRKAIDHLYAAEDLLKPYRAGYGENEKAA